MEYVLKTNRLSKSYGHFKALNDLTMTVAMETKGHASAAELHPIPNSEIVRRFRKGMGQEKAIPGCE